MNILTIQIFRRSIISALHLPTAFNFVLMLMRMDSSETSNFDLPQTSLLDPLIEDAISTGVVSLYET